MKYRLLVVATAYQSIVTILDSKLKILARHPSFDVCAASSEEEPGEERKPAVVFFPVHIPRAIRVLGDIHAVFSLIFLIRRERFDLVHTHTAKAGFVGAIAGWICGVPVIHSYHGLPFFPGQKRTAYNIYKFIEICLSWFRQCLFTQNHFDFETLGHTHALRCPVMYEGNGVDVGTVRENASRYSPFVKSIFSDASFKIACVARLEPVKYLYTLIDAVKFLKSKGVNVECVIAGKGPLKQDLETRIHKNNLHEILKIIYTPYIHALINCADCVVLTSIKEGIPRSLMEAMALSKPVVATDVAGTNELVLHEKTGILVPFNDQDKFNEAILRLINDAALRLRLGISGHQRIVERFNENAIIGLWIEQYEKQLSNRHADIR